MKPRTPPDSPLLFDTAPLVPDFRLELKARKAGHWPVAGADEAGRGRWRDPSWRPPSFSIRSASLRG